MAELVKKQAKKNTAGIGGTQVISLVKGLALSFAITCVVFFAYALILTYSQVGETRISFVALICTAASTLAAGFVAAKGAASKGLLWGMGAGACYALILIAIGVLSSIAPGLDMGKLTTLCVSAAGGGIGGILGINGKPHH